MLTNELLLTLSLLIIYSGVIIWFILFEKKGLTGFTVLATIAANIEALILVKAFGMEQTLGNVLFASTFLITDILSELYGKKEAQKAVNIGIATSITFIIISQSWMLYTPTENDFAMPSISTIFSNTPRLMIASLITYAICQRFDVWVYHKVWDITTKKSNNSRKFLWIRNNASTLLSQLLNTVLFTFGAFLGIYNLPTLLSICLSSYVIFIITSLVDTPFVYLARKLYDKKAKPC